MAKEGRHGRTLEHWVFVFAKGGDVGVVLDLVCWQVSVYCTFIVASVDNDAANSFVGAGGLCGGHGGFQSRTLRLEG